MTWKVTAADIDSQAAQGELRAYYAELVSRYFDRPATPESVDAAMADEPSGDLTPPSGLFLLAEHGGTVGGCVGVRLIERPDRDASRPGRGTALPYEPQVAELTRLFVRPERRGSGGGAALLAAAEEAARGLGVHLLRMDTRKDLVEARALYARHGYAEVPAFNEGPYADHWFAKHLV
ncbi:GNAT family N-acetyltransferase [Streptomyces sp. XM4193]|uniref:GNAT family N-acetyltransferase n=1 Tax=Streptomyces sp. XM4193 TaxID=2929782 RepID=UPI001FFB0499|nr:GNAT family N-acetyltransferase [Streptomyces sp. XM4193]MCK1797410.1 GNAT family N-acetyltransferase [Streptomyces sp. XM4193]